jgi:iron(III) transport system substrate-binding protein
MKSTLGPSTVLAAALALTVVLATGCAPAAAPAKPAEQPKAAAPAEKAAPAPAKPESIDELYEKAKQEGGALALYASINPNTTAKIFPAFEQRFPGVKIDWVDATGEKLVARITAEARGGKVLADAVQTNIDHVAAVKDQGLLVDWLPPEAAAYPDGVKGPYWLASDLKFYVLGWNTNLVKKEDEPRQFEDLADPKWKGKLIGDPTDVELIVALAKRKFQNDDKAVELLQKIAANNPEFHVGHSDVVEMLAAGQGSVCMTCFSHHFPPRLKKGVPLGYSLTEGIGLVSANAILKDAPHPNTAKLWVRWVATEEGQKVYADAGATPAHPAVEPVEKTRPEKILALGAEFLKEYPRYLDIWRATFQLR